MLNTRRLAALVAVGSAGIIAGTFILYRFNPVTAGFYPKCVFHSLTGLDCPGCGATRALYQLVHGHVAAAFRLNPMLMFYAPVLTFGAGETARAWVTGEEPKALTTRPWLAWAITASIIGWWIVRNTPLWPH